MLCRSQSGCTKHKLDHAASLLITLQGLISLHVKSMSYVTLPSALSDLGSVSSTPWSLSVVPLASPLCQAICSAYTSFLQTFLPMVYLFTYLKSFPKIIRSESYLYHLIWKGSIFNHTFPLTLAYYFCCYWCHCLNNTNDLQNTPHLHVNCIFCSLMDPQAPRTSGKNCTLDPSLMDHLGELPFCS